MILSLIDHHKYNEKFLKRLCKLMNKKELKKGLKIFKGIDICNSNSSIVLLRFTSEPCQCCQG